MSAQQDSVCRRESNSHIWFGAGLIPLLAVGLGLTSGCRTMSPREVVLLDSRGVLPPPYVEPAAADDAPGVEPDFPDFDPLPSLEPLPPDIETDYPDPDDPDFAPLVPEPPPTEVESDLIAYTVQPGDSLWRISRMYGITHQELAAYNNMELDDVLRVGRELRIPPGGRLVPEAERTTAPPRPRPERETRDSRPPARSDLQPGEKYTVRRGDSLSVIARDFGVRINEIKALNDLTSDIIYEGQTLVIPQTADATQPQPPPTESEPPIVEEEEDIFTWQPEPEPSGRTEPPPSSLDTITHFVVEGDDSLADIAAMYGVRVEALRQLNPGISDRDLRPDMQIKVPILE